MNKLIAILVAFVMGGALTGCGLVHTPKTIPPGNVGILVDMRGSNPGVEQTVLQPHRIWVNWYQELYLFPTYRVIKNFTASKSEDTPEDESFTFTSADGLPFNLDVGVSYSLDQKKIPYLFQKNRNVGNDHNAMTNRMFRNALRDALSRYGGQDSANAIMGTAKGRLFDSLQAYVRRELGPEGVIEIRVFSLSDPRPLNEDFKKALAAKVIAAQKVQEAHANLEIARSDSTRTVMAASAEAQANQMKQRSLTPELIQMAWIEHWSGDLPLVSGSSGNYVDLSDIAKLRAAHKGKGE